MAQVYPRLKALGGEMLTLMIDGPLPGGGKAWELWDQDAGGSCLQTVPVRADLDEWISTFHVEHPIAIDNRGAESVTGYYRDRDPPEHPCALVTWFFTFDLARREHLATYKPDARYEMPPTARALQDFEALLLQGDRP